MLSMDSLPAYRFSSFRYFDPGERHIHRTFREDVLLLVMDGVLRFEEGGNAVEVGALVLEDSIGGFPGYYCEQAGFACYHPPIELLTDENVRDCKEHGVKMNVWTVNDMAGLEQLHRWGCEGIITNYPGVASGWLRAQGE